MAPSYSISEYSHEGVNIIINTSAEYSWYRVFIRKSSESQASYRDFNTTNSFSTYFDGLSPGTSYTVNVYCGTYQGGSSYDCGADNFTTLYSVTVYLGDGIRSVRIRYCYNDNGNYTTSTLYDGDVIPVQPYTNGTVQSIDLYDGYSHPVYCEGSTYWQMTDSDGNFLDSSLYVDNGYKEFVFTSSTSSGSGNGKVWIDGNWYQPYIYTGQWTPATPCIYQNGWTEITDN